MSMKSSSSSPPESLASDRERAIDELVQGRHFAYQLKAFLQNQNQNQNQNQSPTPPAQDLVLNVLNSFTNTLSILNPTHSDHHRLASPSSELRKSEDSGDSCRSSSSTKYPRGCYKRRKTSQYSWTIDSPDLVDDGNAWRKYGQKQILNAKYPRNYYRCTHKHEQKCEAKKQVQRIEEDPPLYRTIYNGNHTCNNLQKANHLYIDYHESDDANDSFVLLSFNNNNNHHDQNHPLSTTALASSMKQEDHFSTQNNIVNQSTSTSSDHLLSTDDQAAFINNSSSCTTTTAAADDDYGFHVDHLMEDPLQFDDDVFAVCI